MTVILVVEDNEMNLDVLIRWFEMNDYDTLSAKNGETGLEIAKSEKPDIIIMDINLPDMSGFEVIKRIKDSTELKNIKIIALTAFTYNGQKRPYELALCDSYKTKPVDLDELLETIENF